MLQCGVYSFLHANGFSNNTCPCQAVLGKCALGCLKMTPWQLRSSNMLKVTGSWLNHKRLESGHNQWRVLNCRICSLPRFIGAWIFLISQACHKTHLFSEAFPEVRNKMRRVYRWFDRIWIVTVTFASNVVHDGICKYARSGKAGTQFLAQRNSLVQIELNFMRNTLLGSRVTNLSQNFRNTILLMLISLT